MDLPDPGIELGSPALLQEDSLPTELSEKPIYWLCPDTKLKVRGKKNKKDRQTVIDQPQDVCWFRENGWVSLSCQWRLIRIGCL